MNIRKTVETLERLLKARQNVVMPCQGNMLSGDRHSIHRSQGKYRGMTREFSSDVLYRTEREADTHEIAFGESLIEGEVL